MFSCRSILLLEFLFRYPEHVSRPGVLNERDDPRSVRSGLNRKRDVFRGGAVEIDRAHLFEDSRNGDVRQGPPGVFSAGYVGLHPVVGDRDV